MTFYLAQVNIARMLAPLDSPVMADFVSALDPINAQAETFPGFIWRLKSDDGNDATSIRPYDDDYIIVNMSVWENIDALFQFTYTSDHVDVFRRRREWFESMKVPYLALWYTQQMPTPEEARKRLEHLEAHGPTPYAFTFKKRFTVDDLA